MSASARALKRGIVGTGDRDNWKIGGGYRRNTRKKPHYQAKTERTETSIGGVSCHHHPTSGG